MIFNYIRYNKSIIILITFISLILGTILIISGCSPDPKDSSQYEVYVVGDEGSSPWDYGRVMLWKNGDGKFFDNRAVVNAITMKDDSIYMAGGFVDQNDIKHACYWIDEVRYPLTDDGDACALAMKFVGNDLYIVGYNNGKACFWKNGSRTDLLESNSEANSIAFIGSTQYISGYYLNGTKFIACYWEDGVMKNLNGLLPNRNSYAKGVATSGQDVYIVGYYYDGLFNQAVYWKNNTKYDLSGNNTQANSIFVSGNNIYIGGINDNKACFWVNNNRTDATPLECMNSMCYSIYVLKNDIYITGWYSTLTSHSACYWKNNVRTDLNLTSSSGATANAIFVMQKN